MKNKIGIFLALFVVFFWGISFVGIKIVVAVIPPVTMATLRFAISLFILWIFAKVTAGNHKIPSKARKNSILAGFWGITVYFIFENFGVNFTTPSQASLLISTVPIFTIIIIDIVSRKRSSMKLYAMSVLSLIGVSIIILSNGLDLGGNAFGDILILGAAISWGMYTFYVEKLSEYDNLLTTLEITKWGLIFLIPFSVIEMIIERPNPLTFIKPDVILWLLFLAALCSGFGYVIWNYVIRALGSRTSSNFIYLIPVVSIIADSLILKNIPSIWIYIGGIVTTIGVIFGERIGRKEDIKAPV